MDQNLTPTPAAAELTLSELCEVVNKELVRLHAERLERLGLEESGLYNYYKTSLERAAIVGPRDRATFQLISASLPPCDGFGVLKAGLGELALLLAASGRKVIAFEPHFQRRTAIQAGKARLLDIGLIGQGMIGILAPPAPEGPFPNRMMGIGLNAVTAGGEATDLVARLQAFDCLLVDLRLLFRLRNEETEREAAAASLAELGFKRSQFYTAQNLTWFERR